ncbi:DivIVA domain-containing protein [Arsenicicoccus cauae]|uniref:DivIVA domain-containing protein n=1 Tax=Arsenicicoccus cauae TaxID=2663847 RepID=UPI00370D7415
MALTPDDVLKKSFGATQFRRGYDEREVDDFLDEVVSELRDLIAERDDYKRKYEETARGKGQTPVPAAGRAATAPSAELDKLRAEVAAANKRADEATRRSATDEGATSAAARTEVTQLRQRLQAVEKDLESTRAELTKARSAQAQQAKAAEKSGDADEAAGLIALAQRLHDEHVAKGKAEHERLLTEARQQRETLIGEGTRKRDELVTTAQRRHDELIAEGQERHKKLIADGTAKHETMVGEATRQREGILSDMVAEKATLEQAVASLQAYEASYRESIKTFLRTQLQEVEQARLAPPQHQQQH